MAYQWDMPGSFRAIRNGKEATLAPVGTRVGLRHFVEKDVFNPLSHQDTLQVLPWQTSRYVCMPDYTTLAFSEPPGCARILT